MGDDCKLSSPSSISISSPAGHMPPSSSPPVSPFQASLTGSGLPYIFNFFPHANTPAFHKILGVVLSNATGNFHRHWTRMFRLVKGRAVC
jgi:hypothetical protein